MIFTQLAEDAQRRGYSREWKPWFAWYPVDTLDNRTVWLRVVFYRWDGSGYDPGYEYMSVEGLSNADTDADSAL